uniref:KRAB domain-containing protein n=1 Tax=Laticauda laticaudata TaxID=8630 RepID=A0A8C5SG99_LATLA
MQPTPSSLRSVAETRGPHEISDGNPAALHPACWSDELCQDTWSRDQNMRIFSGIVQLTRSAFVLQIHVSFEDVTIFFSEEEWDLLDFDQKSLYREVMLENAKNVETMGKSCSRFK